MKKCIQCNKELDENMIYTNGECNECYNMESLINSYRKFNNKDKNRIKRIIGDFDEDILEKYCYE